MLTSTHLAHFLMFTISSVLSTVKRADYAFNRSIWRTCTSMYQSIQTTGSTFTSYTRAKCISFRCFPFSLSTAPRLGQTVAGYLHWQGISVLLYLDDSLIRHLDRQVLLYHQSQLLAMLRMMSFKLTVAKSELEPVQDIHFLSS